MFLVRQVFPLKSRDGVFDLIVHMIMVHIHDISSLDCIENFAADVTSRQYFQYQEILAGKTLKQTLKDLKIGICLVHYKNYWLKWK